MTFCALYGEKKVPWMNRGGQSYWLLVIGYSELKFGLEPSDFPTFPITNHKSQTTNHRFLWSTTADTERTEGGEAERLRRVLGPDVLRP